MANTTGGDRPQYTPWTQDRTLILPAAIPSSSTTFYPGQAVMRDANGNMIQCDDTQKGEFIGFLQDFIRVQVDPADSVQQNGLLGDKMFEIIQPQMFTCLIASASAGQEGRKVYWTYNNQVSFSPGTNANFAGIVWFVKDSTHVTVIPPWMCPPLGNLGNNTLSGSAATINLTKFDLRKTFQIPSSVSQTVYLPPVAFSGSGDRITFIQTGSTTQALTLSGYGGTEKINGATTYSVGTSQYSKVTLESDTTQWFVV